MPGLFFLIKQMEEEYKIATKLVIVGNKRRFAPEVEIVLFRIVQEALRNIYKHAQASKAEIIIEFTETLLCITITDNGKGFQPPQEYQRFIAYW